MRRFQDPLEAEVGWRGGAVYGSTTVEDTQELAMPPPEPRASLPPPEPLQADGLHALEESADADLRELTDDERAAAWLHTGLGFEVG